MPIIMTPDVAKWMDLLPSTKNGEGIQKENMYFLLILVNFVK